MGQIQTKNPIFVLVIGLKGVGKTHFLDLLEGHPNLQKLPTHGYHEAIIEDIIHFIEYGNTNTKHKQLYHPHFDIILCLLNTNYSEEECLISRSLLAQMAQLLPPNTPILIVYKGNRGNYDLEKMNEWLQLGFFAEQKRKVSFLYMDFDEKQSFEEGSRRLTEWIKKNA